MSVILLLGGMVALILGAEGLVRGGGKLALLMRIPVAIIGLTLVAWGTSAPELVVSVTAALTTSTDMALGNVLGSSVANIGLVLGLAALARPLPADAGVTSFDYGVLLATQLVLPAMLLDGVIGEIDGAVLVGIGLAYNGALVRGALRDRRHVELSRVTRPRYHWAVYLLLATGGIAALAFGSRLFIDGASEIALTFGVSYRVIGLTIVAFGTSAPELATSLVASIRGQSDVSIGNVVGSNIFNTVFALGITAMLRPIPYPGGHGIGTGIDLGVVLLFTLALIPFLVRRRAIERSHGALLSTAYVAYIAYLIVA